MSARSHPAPPPAAPAAAAAAGALAGQQVPAPAEPTVSRDVVLSCVGICVSFGRTRVLQDATLTVHRGTAHALIGPNGAGKTTLANVITGHVPAHAGQVLLDGQPLTGAPWRRARRGVGRKFQQPRVFPRLTGAQQLELASPGSGLAARSADPDGPDARRLAEVATVDGGELSHGLRQWLELQMVLAQRPSLVVLDEPTAGLTAADRDQLAATIRGRAGDSSFLIVEHDLDFVAGIADAVSFMTAGRVAITGRYDDVRADPLVRETYLGSYA
jgi:ABC-type uncharacterized transport system ATPase subunit